MGIGYKHGGSGGCAGLNFRVVGGTSQPASPRENDIWVNTSTEIGSWIFSPTEPESPSEGRVWIVVDVDGVVALNVLKKNEIELWLAGCKQYINGAWASVGAAIFQDEWVEFAYEREYLYNNGETAIVWTGRGTDTDTALVMATQHGNYSGSYSSNGWKCSESLVTVPNGTTKLCMRYSVSYTEGAASNLQYAYLGLSNKVYNSYPGRSTDEFAAYASIANTGSDIIAETPITAALYGNEYYVGVKAGSGSNNVKVTSSWTITEIWFE